MVTLKSKSVPRNWDVKVHCHECNAFLQVVYDDLEAYKPPEQSNYYLEPFVRCIECDALLNFHCSSIPNWIKVAFMKDIARGEKRYTICPEVKPKHSYAISEDS